MAIASVLEAHADTSVRANARASRAMLTAAEAAFGMSMGTVIGRTRRGPFSRRVSQASRSVQSPPIPVEYSTPSRSGARSVIAASAQASRAEMSAYCAEGSRRLISWRSSTSSGRTRACAAKVTGSSCSATQSCVSERTPVSPASNAFQLSRAVPPSGDVAPIPVTTIFLVIPTPVDPRACRGRTTTPDGVGR